MTEQDMWSVVSNINTLIDQNYDPNSIRNDIKRKFPPREIRQLRTVINTHIQQIEEYLINIVKVEDNTRNIAINIIMEGPEFFYRFLNGEEGIPSEHDYYLYDLLPAEDEFFTVPQYSF